MEVVIKPCREDVPVYAITMGVGTILDARKLVLVASGKTKAKAIGQAVEGPVTSMVTASALQLHRDATVIVDEQSAAGDRKSTRLNSSHVAISYAVFCLK